MHIETEHLSHIYSPGMPYATAALTDVSLTVESGEFTGIIGHTGSGKSTLLMHLCGLLAPAKGRVLADGVNINEKSPAARKARRRIGVVFQYPEYQLFEESVLKDVCFGPRNYGFSEEECLKKARSALEMVGLDWERIGEKSPFELSGGEKRRAAMAGVLATEPELLILDEPTAGLDPEGHRYILDMIESIKREKELTIILVSHNMDDVARLSDRVIVMDSGRLIMNASPQEVFSRKEKLKAMGLGLPNCPSLLEMLAERGLKLRTDIFDMDEAAAEIARACKERWL